jgi:acylphosphatase
MPNARQFTIKGRVQGVFFRDSTRRVAQSLGLTGYAVNKSNGDVEVLACGESDAIDALAIWLKDGPRMAEVTDVIAHDAEVQETDGFTTA